MREQTSQERAFAVTKWLIGFTSESQFIGMREEKPPVVRAVTGLNIVEAAMDDPYAPLVGLRMSVAWPYEPVIVDLQQQVFDLLAEQWQEETGALSSTTEMVMHPAYQTIMTFGDKGVSFILRQLEREGDQPNNWFWALRHMTRANPVPPEHRGNRRAMAKDWLDWARSHPKWRYAR